MGCMLGKDARAVGFEDRRERKEEAGGRSGRKEGVKNRVSDRDAENGSEASVASTCLHHRNENEEEDDQSVRSKQEGAGGRSRRRHKRRSSMANPRLSNPPKHLYGEQVAAGWPPWLSAVAGEAIRGWIPRRADSFEKINKIGQGTYSNVYKARDLITGKIVALKKVRFDNLEPESVKFMAREILILRRLDHINVVNLEGLVTSRMSCSLYLVFEYMEHDLAGLVSSPTIKFTESQVKCFMQQLLSGLEHCHNRHVLHRDIKGSNLLIGNDGILRIADFGLASFFDPNHRQAMTSRVVTLWYRPPELLLGATEYGVGVDLWSAGCILAELLAGKPIMPGRNEVEQLHKIFKLCGSPCDEYWRKSKLPQTAIFRSHQTYKRCIRETFKDFPPSSLPLIETFLSLDPSDRLTATSALNCDFFATTPYACEPADLPKYPPSKEMDARLRDEEARRLRSVSKVNPDGVKKVRLRDRTSKACPAPEANAELQSTLDRRRLITHSNAKSKSEKFPPPHQDGTLGFPLGSSHRIDPVSDYPDLSFSSTIFPHSKPSMETWSGPLNHTGVSVVKKTKQKDRKSCQGDRRHIPL